MFLGYSGKIHPGVGGVTLGVGNETSLRRAFAEMMARVRRVAPQAHVLGICVQPMVPEGTEVVVGNFRDAQAGLGVMFGLGGIWVEALKDVVFRLAPVSESEARRMIEEIRGVRVLEGLRGKPPVNQEALAHLIVTIGSLMDVLPIEEVDCNSVIFHNGTYPIADARISLLEAKPHDRQHPNGAQHKTPCQRAGGSSGKVLLSFTPQLVEAGADGVRNRT